MSLPRSPEGRRFAALWSLSTFVKIAALAVFLAVVLSWTGVR